MWVQFREASFEANFSLLHDFRINLIKVRNSVVLLDIFIQFKHRDFITHLIFAVIFIFLLNSIISQMNHVVVQRIFLVFVGRGSNVPFFVPIPLDASIYLCNKSVAPNIKFSFIVKQWLIYILLDYKALVPLVLVNYVANMFKSFRNFNAVSSVGVFGGFNDPDIIQLILFIVFKVLGKRGKFLTVCASLAYVECLRHYFIQLQVIFKAVLYQVQKKFFFSSYFRIVYYMVVNLNFLGLVQNSYLLFSLQFLNCFKLVQTRIYN